MLCIGSLCVAAAPLTPSCPVAVVPVVLDPQAQTALVSATPRMRIEEVMSSPLLLRSSRRRASAFAGPARFTQLLEREPDAGSRTLILEHSGEQASRRRSVADVLDLFVADAEPSCLGAHHQYLFRVVSSAGER